MPYKRRKTDNPPKNVMLHFDLIGNSFSKDKFVLVTRTQHDGKIVKETFHANKLPCFLNSLCKSDPDAYAQFLNKAINVLNSD